MFFAKIQKKSMRKYQMLCVKGEMIHIYGKKGNNKRENIGKADRQRRKSLLILQKRG